MTTSSVAKTVSLSDNVVFLKGESRQKRKKKKKKKKCPVQKKQTKTLKKKKKSPAQKKKTDFQGRNWLLVKNTVKKGILKFLHFPVSETSWVVLCH